jgi:Polyketide cyclase / dehydrase and lipid transport
MKSRFAAERRMNVPAQVAYHCLADYREHHRPEGFLPSAFSAFEVHRGGVGDGTEASWAVELGGRTRRMSAEITEPEPGRRLVETDDGVVTTFTVAPSGGGCVVRFDTVFDEPGLGGILLRLLIGRMLGPLHADELERLDAYSHAHRPVAVAA